MKNRNVGIILPSGGCKCAFQAGALKAVEETIPPENIRYLQGVSGGILNASKFISEDFKANNLIQVWEEVERMGVKRLFDLFTVILNQIGQNQPNVQVEELLKKLDTEKILRSHTRLDIIVRNLETNTAELFSSKDVDVQSGKISLTKLILASASIPGMMPPVRIAKRFGDGRTPIDYCDGFVWLPEALKKIGRELDLILIIDPEHQVDPFSKELKPFWVPAGSWKSFGGSNYIYFDNLRKSMQLLELIADKTKIKVVKPTRSFQNLSVISFSKGEISEAIQHGYALTLQVLKKL